MHQEPKGYLDVLTDSAPAQLMSGSSDGKPADRARVLLSWSDPEWPLCMAFLLSPALLFLALGDVQRASFFLGTALFIGSLKWLGWLFLTRGTALAPAFVAFPAELFLGLTAACGWFYLRNLVAWFWPASYSLVELSVLPWFLVVLHVLRILLGRWRALAPEAVRGQGKPAALRQRAALYAPYCVTLLVALFQASNALEAPGSDAIHHAFVARVYLHEGVFFPLRGDQPISYPSGFGAINAVTAALTPLTVVQSVNLQHVLWLVTSLFLVTTTVVLLAGRSLWFVHSLPLLYLCVFPLYSLFPFIYYQGTARQVAPATLTALCLVPLFIAVRSSWRFYSLVGLVGGLGVLTVALNPTCAPLVAAAWLVALLLNCVRGRSLVGQPVLRVICAQGLLTAAAAALLWSCDTYYNTLARSPERTGLVSAPATAAAAPTSEQPRGFSIVEGLRAARSTYYLAISSELFESVLFNVYPQLSHMRGWQAKLPQRAFPWLALASCLAALYLVFRRRRQAPRDTWLPLAAFILGCVVLWVVLTAGIHFLAGGIPASSTMPAILKSYTVFLLIRCQVILVFAAMLSAGTVLYLLASQSRRHPAAAKLWIIMALPALWCAVCVCILANDRKSGYVVMPAAMEGRITPGDLNLVAWIDDHIPPDRGRVGLAARITPVGRDRSERALCPIGVCQALILYGKHYNFCFSQLDPGGGFSYTDYQKNVAESFNAEWCLSHNIRYFCIPRNSLPENVGLAQAINQGVLKQVKRIGDAGVFEVVAPPGAAATAT